MHFHCYPRLLHHLDVLCLIKSADSWYLVPNITKFGAVGILIILNLNGSLRKTLKEVRRDTLVCRLARLDCITAHGCIRSFNTYIYGMLNFICHQYD